MRPAAGQHESGHQLPADRRRERTADATKFDALNRERRSIETEMQEAALALLEGSILPQL